MNKDGLITKQQLEIEELKEDTKQLKRHVFYEMEKSKTAISTAKMNGLDSELVAWNHTFLAYQDILSKFK